MKKINLHSMRLDILNVAKKHIILNGWNDTVFLSIAKKKQFKIEEIRALFPKGYRSLLELYLINTDQEMTKACKKIDLIRIKTHERIKAIILMRLKINEKDKELAKRTFFTLMLPQHARLAASSLYNTIDQIWYLAGDNSTNFNFYTKRGILSGIYLSTILYWLNKKNSEFKKTEQFLNLQLNNVSKIPKIKKRFSTFVDFTPKIFSFIKSFSRIRQ